MNGVLIFFGGAVVLIVLLTFVLAFRSRRVDGANPPANYYGGNADVLTAYLSVEPGRMGDGGGAAAG